TRSLARRQPLPLRVDDQSRLLRRGARLVDKQKVGCHAQYLPLLVAEEAEAVSLRLRVEGRSGETGHDLGREERGDVPLEQRVLCAAFRPTCRESTSLPRSVARLSSSVA